MIKEFDHINSGSQGMNRESTNLRTLNCEPLFFNFLTLGLIQGEKTVWVVVGTGLAASVLVVQYNAKYLYFFIGPFTCSLVDLFIILYPIHI